MPMRPSHPGSLTMGVLVALTLIPHYAIAQGWQRQAVPTLPAGSTFSLASVTALDSNRLWASGIVRPSYDSFVLRTTDGGTWTLVHRAAGEGSFADIRMLSDTAGYVSGSGVRLTTDGGATWAVEQSTLGDAPGYHHGIGPEGWVYGMTVVADGNIWTAGYDGAIAGVIYHRVPGRPNPGSSNLNAPWWLEWAANYRGMYGIAAVNASVAWSVGYAGWIWKTVDGQGWGQQASPTGAALYDVIALDVNTAWAVGVGGTIIKTTDGGTTWTAQSSGTTWDLWRIAAFDTLHAWAVGSNGTILHTTDGGQTWAPQYSGTRETLNGVVATSAQRAWIVGDNNTVLHTTDGGTGNWPAPTIASISRTVAGRSSWPYLTMSIVGTGFRGGNLAVAVGGIACDARWVDEQTIDATLPAGLLGTYDVTVTNEDGQSATLPRSVTFIAEPTVLHYSPTHGPATGAFSITVAGLNLQSITSAEIYNSATSGYEALPIAALNSTELILNVPASAGRTPGRVYIILRTGVNQSVMLSEFELDAPAGATFAVNGISPRSGPAGTAVTVTGVGFDSSITMELCGRDVTITSRSATQLTGNVAGYPGVCQLRLTDGVDRWLTIEPAFFLVGAPTPSITGVTPSTGSPAGGTTVTITGTGFDSTEHTVVTFDGYPAPTVSRTATQVVVTSPPHALGPVDVVVVPSDGSDDAIGLAATVAAGFTYADVPPSPLITDISPASVGTSGGTRITITGTGFPAVIAPNLPGIHAEAATGMPTITVGGVPATGVTVVNATTITCFTPVLQATTGANVVIAWPDGSSATSSGPLALAIMDPAAHAGHDDDGDGIPDTVELAFGLDPGDPADATGDPDGDGATNAQEAAAGTHPMGTATRYLAEGATGSLFQTRLALANPSTAPAHALLRYAKADGSLVTQTVLVPATGRATVDVETVTGMATAEFATTIEADRAIVVDRTLRWSTTGHYGSHAERSVPAPATTWYLAEGATHSGFDLFYLLQNPSATTANVTVTYLLPAGAPLTKQYTVAGNTRFNIWVNVEQIPEGSGATPLASTDVSAIVSVTNGVPIIVERAVYLTRGGQMFAAGHDSAGVTSPALSWFLAEGNTGPYFDLFVLIANPNPQAAEITADYLLVDGTVITRTYRVEPTSRFNIWVDLEDPRLLDAAVSTTVTSTNGVAVIVERAMWWPGDFSSWMEAHNSPGSTETATRWGLAEGEVGGDDAVETYILIANTSAYAGRATVTLLFEDGTTASQAVDLLPKSRTNVPVKDAFGAAVSGRRFGAVVATEAVGAHPAAQVVVERAMYSSVGGVWWSAGTNALATKLP